MSVQITADEANKVYDGLWGLADEYHREFKIAKQDCQDSGYDAACTVGLAGVVAAWQHAKVSLSAAKSAKGPLHTSPVTVDATYPLAIGVAVVRRRAEEEAELAMDRMRDLNAREGRK